jgi:arginyl-tRNA synthetase
MNLLQLLQERLRPVLQELVADPAPYVAMVKPSQDMRFGDYQANCAMSLAKVLGRKPRDVAEGIVKRLRVEDVVERMEVAGPGFINFHVRTDWLADEVQKLGRDESLGVPRVGSPQTLVIDFSSPNVAKPLHVGHLRSTIIGDSLTRLFRFLGHKVITDNHLGDWGTQFGMLLFGYKNYRNEKALAADPVREMLRLYVMVRDLIKPAEDEDEAEGTNDENTYTEAAKQVGELVANAARHETAKLHAGDPENVQLWQMFMPWCMPDIQRIYDRLSVHFDYTHGESFYNPMLPEVVKHLLESGIARESEGAVAIFFGEDETPALIRKRDGAFTYTTSDLATIRYRMEQWKPDAILYVVGSPQALHFKNLFAAARRWGYDRVKLEHIAFGSVLGQDRRPLKTREGGVIELEALLQEAVQRGEQVYEQSRAERLAAGREVPDLSDAERQSIAEVVGLGAVKYADLSQNRTSDYVFNWDKMLATDGNTATYMQYAYVRNRGIFREGNEDARRYRTDAPAVSLVQPSERALALQVIRFPEAIAEAAADFRPHSITTYLWELSKSFSAFYQHCPVLKAETPQLRQSRLLLCDLTARIIQKGLDLLGIRTVERM